MMQIKMECNVIEIHMKHYDVYMLLSDTQTMKGAAVLYEDKFWILHQGAKIYQALNSLASCKHTQYKWVGTYSGWIFGTYSQAKIGRAIDCNMRGVMTLTARCSGLLVAKTPILANTKTQTLANTKTPTLANTNTTHFNANTGTNTEISQLN